MKKIFLLLLLLPLLFAQERVHVVKKGDTLWDIAGFYYQNPFLWPYIWRANLEKISDPHWIYPDQEFVIPPSPEAMPSELPPPPEEEYLYEEETIPTEEAPPPEPEEIESTEVSSVKPELSIFTEPFIHRAGMILEEEWADWGRIISSAPKGERHLTTYKDVYINRGEGDVKVGDILTVYRPGPDIFHPKTGSYLGKVIRVLGKLEVTAVERDRSKAKVVTSYEIIHPGDRLIPYEEIIIPTSIELVKTDRLLEGYIVHLLSKDYLTAPHSIAYIDLGSLDGISCGDVFKIFRPKGKDLPEEIVGELQVLSTRSNTATTYFRWTRTAERFHRGDRIRLYMETR